jgi:hypothetical protein
MFPQTGEWAGGEAAFPAAIKALEQINQREDILPGYYLNLSAYDTRVNITFPFLSYKFFFYSYCISVHPVWVQQFYMNYSIIKLLVVSTVPY